MKYADNKTAASGLVGYGSLPRSGDWGSLLAEGVIQKPVRLAADWLPPANGSPLSAPREWQVLIVILGGSSPSVTITSPQRVGAGSALRRRRD